MPEYPRPSAEAAPGHKHLGGAHRPQHYSLQDGCLGGFFVDRHSPRRGSKQTTLLKENTSKLAYSPKEAAEAIGISVAKLYTLIQAGKITINKIGRLTRIRVTELERFLDSCEVDR